LNKTKTLEENDEIINTSKSKRKFVSKEEIEKLNEREIGFKEDMKRETLDSDEIKDSNFEKEFFESFKKGPYNRDTGYDNDSQREMENLNKMNQKNKKKEKKSKNQIEEDFDEEQEITNFQSKK